jgi:hypothetical protein
MTKGSYFGGRYMALMLEELFPVWGIPVMKLAKYFRRDRRFLDAFNHSGVRL